MEMMSMQTSGLVTAIVGFVATILICALPMWRVTTCLGSNNVGTQSYTDGLWVTCVNDGTGQSQCRYYSSQLEISPDLLIARPLVVTALITTFAAIIIFVMRGAFSGCMGGNRGNRGAIIALTGSLFFTSAILILVSVSFTASNIINNSYTPTGPEAVSRELGAAIYIGFIAFALLLASGIVLSRLGIQYPQDSYTKNYKGVKTCDSTGYPMKDYV
ncbi:PREDICTED: claudin-4-like [Lepidothrix coronata]|uniref:Claudin n=1 Tax=Lepidothrix coronata TaxID=321398 RepID=A0A6J0I123_9PASS|nr:PREDICTED: claudin-4-like [Lepidothrix coronata]